MKQAICNFQCEKHHRGCQLFGSHHETNIVPSTLPKLLLFPSSYLQSSYHRFFFVVVFFNFTNEEMET